MKYILMDVEGTTTSISFVHDQLFPYSKEHIRSYIDAHLNSPSVQEILLKTQSTVREEEDVNLSLDGLKEKLLEWINTDRKHGALKKLQGLIWNEGYESGELKGHVYEDVPKAFKKWNAAGFTMGIYSSGSVEAQRDLFGFSIYGDLNPFISHNFDTNVGPKRNTKSYNKILADLNLSGSDVLFLSDIAEELDAAKEAGMQTIQLVRNGKIPMAGHRQIKSFDEIKL